MRCRLILLISEHPIQQGIRKGGGPYFRLRRGRGRTEWRILGSWICMKFIDTVFAFEKFINLLSFFQILLDVNGEADDIRELERWRAEQLPVRERGAGALPRALEPGRQGPPVERHPLLLRDLLRLRGLRKSVRTKE